MPISQGRRLTHNSAEQEAAPGTRVGLVTRHRRLGATLRRGDLRRGPELALANVWVQPLTRRQVNAARFYACLSRACSNDAQRPVLEKLILVD